MPVELAHLIAALSNFGAWGILTGYFIWDRQCERKERRQRETDQTALAEKEIVSREKLATSLTSLCMVIQGRPGV